VTEWTLVLISEKRWYLTLPLANAISLAPCQTLIVNITDKIATLNVGRADARFARDKNMQGSLCWPTAKRSVACARAQDFLR
jgi:hypothetical protein